MLSELYIYEWKGNETSLQTSEQEPWTYKPHQYKKCEESLAKK